jgi:hypothetical protein
MRAVEPHAPHLSWLETVRARSSSTLGLRVGAIPEFPTRSIQKPELISMFDESATVRLEGLEPQNRPLIWCLFGHNPPETGDLGSM